MTTAVQLCADSKLGYLQQLRNRLVIHSDGELCLVLEVEEGPHAAYLYLSGPKRLSMIFVDLRLTRGGAPQGVIVETERRIVSVLGSRIDANNAQAGDVVFDEDGTFLLCTHWQNGDGAVALVSPHTGAWKTFYPNAPMIAFRGWKLSGFCGDRCVWEINSHEIPPAP